MKNMGNLSAHRLLFFGGCYSNLAATLAMREKASQLDIPAQHIICTGDLVAYCGEPAQTVDLIRDWGIHVLMGNCEESLGFEQLDCGCGFDQQSVCSLLSVGWYRFASAQVTPEQRSWMKALPRLIEFEFQSASMSVVHGSVTSINQFVFASTPKATKLDQIRQANADAVIGGHSGIPFGQIIDHKSWLNSGVIGMPANDGSADGWYMLLEPNNAGYRVSWHRLVYDAKSSQKSTLAAGMVEYAEALTTGLWPSMDVLPLAEQRNRGKRLQVEPIRSGESNQSL
ncbi:MAG: putative phosphodiesterase [Gammaproteobacteria bacterium]|jgi:predicted phosphodiesterase